MAERGARLLVADDNRVNRLLLARSLELQGHRVAAAENGRIALEMLGREPFDLMLLDIEMPEMDGFAVMEQLANVGLTLRFDGAQFRSHHLKPVVGSSIFSGVARQLGQPREQLAFLRH